jgi:hypothetical protein
MYSGYGAAFWFTGTSGFSSLTGNEVSILGNPFPQSGWLNGYEAPPNSSNNPINNRLCPNNNSEPWFYNKRISGALTQGTIFIILSVSNDRNISQTTFASFVNLRYNISVRTSTLTWSPVNDLNGVSTVTQSNGVPSGTWVWDVAIPSKDGLVSTNNIHYGSNDGLVVSNKYTETEGGSAYGAKVFAFNTVGDYRIILGNLQSNYGFYNTSVNCNYTGDSFESSAWLQIGDFYNPPSDIIDPTDFNTYGSTYRYEIVGPNATCATSFPTIPVYKYAKEPFANYVTQLYDDVNFLQPSSLTTGTYKFRRMDWVDSANGNTVFNPEYTKDGAYTASFLSNGSRSSSSIPTPCLYS